MRILATCLQNTLQELEIDYSDVLAIKYLCHCSNMLERVIRNYLDGITLQDLLEQQTARAANDYVI